MYKKYADCHRTQRLLLHVGDKVWRSTKNICSTRSLKKLDYKFVGPFLIIEEIKPMAFQLQLPSSMHIHPVYCSLHVSAQDQVELEEETGTPPPVIVHGWRVGGEFKVAAILDSQIQ